MTTGRGRWLVLLLCHFLGCSQVPIDPAPKSDLVKQVAVRNLETDEAIGDTLRIAPQSGFLAEISLTLEERLPDFLGDRRVRPPNEWPLCVVYYPPGDDAESAAAFHSCCNSLDKFGIVGPFCGVSTFWGDSGYHAPPKLRRSKDKSKLQFWTYIAAPSAEPASYVYEVTLFPTSFWISDVRFDRGEPIVLKRGVLTVTPGNAT